MARVCFLSAPASWKGLVTFTSKQAELFPDVVRAWYNEDENYDEVYNRFVKAGDGKDAVPLPRLIRMVREDFKDERMTEELIQRYGCTNRWEIRND